MVDRYDLLNYLWRVEFNSWELGKKLWMVREILIKMIGGWSVGSHGDIGRKFINIFITGLLIFYLIRREDPLDVNFETSIYGTTK